MMEMVEKCCGWYRREGIESDDEGMKLVNPNMLISLFFLCYCKQRGDETHNECEGETNYKFFFFIHN